MNCQYRYCGAELPLGVNGNRNYCDNTCSYEERLLREKERYGKKKSTLSEITRIEGLLRTCYAQFGDTPFDITILRAQKMNWTLHSSIITSNGEPFRIIGSYGYMALKNSTILIQKF
jgi:hypothetical protein